MGGGMAMIRIESELPTLVDLLPRDAQVRRKLMRLLENAVGDRRGEEVYIHPRWLLQESGMQRESLTRTLRELNKLEGFDYVPPFRGRAVHFRTRDVEFEDLGIDFENLRKRKDAEYDRLNQVVKYAQSPLCRQSSILVYFGDTSAKECGRCDRCGRSPGWPALESTIGDVDQTKGSASKLKQTDVSESPGRSPEPLYPVLEQVVESVSRIHGRLGKILISQYLCGSQNAKVQKLNLHRLSGFGYLKGFRQADAAQVIDALLAAGLLRQKEVNRNRPTVEVAPEWMDQKLRPRLLSMVKLSGAVVPKLLRLSRTSPRPQHGD